MGALRYPDRQGLNLALLKVVREQGGTNFTGDRRAPSLAIGIHRARARRRLESKDPSRPHH